MLACVWKYCIFWLLSIVACVLQVGVLGKDDMKLNLKLQDLHLCCAGFNLVSVLTTSID